MSSDMLNEEMICGWEKLCRDPRGLAKGNFILIEMMDCQTKKTVETLIWEKGESCIFKLWTQLSIAFARARAKACQAFLSLFTVCPLEGHINLKESFQYFKYINFRKHATNGYLTLQALGTKWNSTQRLFKTCAQMCTYLQNLLTIWFF